MNELNDDWLNWPPDALERFFDDEQANERPASIGTAHKNKTYEEIRNEDTWHT